MLTKKDPGAPSQNSCINCCFYAKRPILHVLLESQYRQTKERIFVQNVEHMFLDKVYKERIMGLGYSTHF